MNDVTVYKEYKNYTHVFTEFPWKYASERIVKSGLHSQKL